MHELTIEGVFENGVVRLCQTPPGIQRARVLVTFLDLDGTTQAERYAAGQRLLESMRRGLDFAGARFDRDELYEERLADLDERRQRSNQSKDAPRR
ncbi:MAG TPA: hypothetical protein VGN26_15370 [Armatimonadota bacterium]|jgi:hypothetical protein